MTGNNQGGDRVAKNLLQFTKRNRWLLLGAPAVTLVAAVFFINWTVPIYQGLATVRIDEERSNIAVLDMLQQLSSGASIYTEMAELKSRSLAEDVVDSLDLNVQIDAPRRANRADVFSAVQVARSAPKGEYDLTGKTGVVQVPGATFVMAPHAKEYQRIFVRIEPFQVAVEGLMDQMSIRRPDREADIIDISYQSSDRNLARDVPNAAARLFIQRRQMVKTQQARSTVAFLDTQLDTLGQQLHGYEQTLQKYREGASIVSLDAEGEAQVKRLADFQAQRDLAEAERTSLAKALNEIERAPARPGQPSAYRRLLGFPSILSSSAAGEVLRGLNEVENQRAELLTRRTADDPDVIVLTNRLNDMEDQLHSLVATNLAGLSNRIASIDGVLAQFSSELKKIPAKEIELARLKRQAKVTEEIYTTLQGRLKEAQIVAAVQDPSVRVVDPAITPIKPVQPDKPLDLMLALILGIALGASVAFVRENLDTTIHTREELQLESGSVPVLGLIPRIRETSGATNGTRKLPWRVRTAPVATSAELLRAHLVAGRNPRGSASEAYRTLRTNLTFAQPEKPPRTLVFTSAAPGDGKSTSSSNLAITLGQQGLRAILIDADMRRGQMHEAFNTTNRPGLSDYLLGGLSLEEVIRNVTLEGSSIDFIPTGTLPPNPAELLASPRMQALLEHLEGEYDTVIFDAPPLNVVTDAAVLGARTDGVVMVVRAGVTDRSAVRFAFDQLQAVRARVLGCVLNDVDVKRESYYGTEIAGSYYEGAR